MLTHDETPATLPTFAALQDDDGSWYVNQYMPHIDRARRDGLGDYTCRDTLADGLLETEAQALTDALNRVAARWWLV
jgi:hypothetical protein